jgi:hypothetical protein
MLPTSCRMAPPFETPGASQRFVARFVRSTLPSRRNRKTRPAKRTGPVLADSQAQLRTQHIANRAHESSQSNVSTSLMMGRPNAVTVLRMSNWRVANYPSPHLDGAVVLGTETRGRLRPSIERPTYWFQICHLLPPAQWAATDALSTSYRDKCCRRLDLVGLVSRVSLSSASRTHLAAKLSQAALLSRDRVNLAIARHSPANLLNSSDGFMLGSPPYVG